MLDRVHHMPDRVIDLVHHVRDGVPDVVHGLLRTTHHVVPGTVARLVRPAIGLSSTYANGFAATEFGTASSDRLSLFRKSPVPGLFQREAVPTSPVPGSVQPDWKPR
jgi:hypothetical protein